MLRRLLLGASLIIAVGVLPVFAKQAPPKPAPPPPPASAPAKKENCDLTMEEFMKTNVQATIKDKTLTKEQVNAKMAVYFTSLQRLVPDPKWNEGPNNWKKITTTALDKKSFGTSCKTCHTLFEKKYQADYKDKKICFAE
jgi:hypothetical protein